MNGTNPYDGPEHGYDIGTCVVVDATGNVYVGGGTGARVAGSYYNSDYLIVKYDASGTEQWVRRYAGPGNLDDGINAITLDNAGNVYVTGMSNALSSEDIVTIKYDPAGTEQWIKAYDGPDGTRDEGYDIKVDDLGNVVVVGYARSGGSWNADMLTIKYSPSGNELWTDLYNGPANDYDYASSLGIDDTGNVYVGGAIDIRSSFATLKYNSTGQLLWDRVETSSWFGAIKKLAFDNVGNIVVMGNFDSSSLAGAHVVKYQPSGTRIWSAMANSTFGNGMAVDGSGNVVVVGVNYGVNTQEDFATVKYSSSGIKQWIQNYNGVGGTVDWMQGMKVDRNGNVYLAMWADSYPDTGRKIDMLLVKYSPQGETLWTRKYDNAMLANMSLDSSGNCYLVGSKGINVDSVIVTVKYNSDGSLLWSKIYSSPGSKSRLKATGIDLQGNIYVGGDQQNGAINKNFLLKYDPSGTLLWESQNSSSEAFWAEALVVDKNSNVAMTGYAAGSRTMMWDANGNTKWLAEGNGYSGAISVDDSGNTFISGQDIISKYNPSGAVVWANTNGGPNGTNTVDRDGNLYVAASRPAKYSPSGVQAWHQPSAPAWKVQFDECGYVYVAGDDWIDSTRTVTQTVVSKLDPNSGEILWQSIIYPFNTHGPSIPFLELDYLGQIYVAGTAGVGNGRFRASYAAKLQQVLTLESLQDTISFDSVSIGCTGEATVTLRSSLCAKPNEFSLSSTNPRFSVGALGSVVQSYSEHQFKVRFQPLAEGTETATLTFSHPAWNLSATVYVIGTGISTGSELTLIDTFGTGWQLVSLPVEAPCPYILPGSYLYESNYQARDTLSLGRGYWNKFQQNPTLYFIGNSITNLAVDANMGWNIIGSISEPVAVSNIQSIPPGVVVSQFFAYNGSGYIIADSIRPGRGYWVKVNQDAQLILSATAANAAVANRVMIVRTSEMPPLPPGGGGISENPNPKPQIPDKFKLEQNYPNPFNPVTEFRFSIPEVQFVSLKIYDVLGREVTALVGEELSPGVYTRTWDASGEASGMYYYRLTAGTFTDIKKLLFMK